MERRPTQFFSIARLAQWVVLPLLACVSGCSDPPTKPPPPEAPQLACPAPITVSGVLGAGDMVTYPTATITGGLPPVVVACNPPSGATFPAGTTTATCTANDSLGRQAACSFTVTLVSVTLNARKYLAFGDSVTAGEDGRSLFIRPTFVDPVRSYPAVLQGQLVTSFPAETPTVSNKGKGGEFANDGVSRLVTELDAERPDALLLLEGYNDLLTYGVSAADTVVNALRTDVRNARGRGVRYIIVSTLTPSRKATGPRDRAIDARALQETNAKLVAMASSENALLVDAYTAFLGREATLVGDDGLHLTAEGNQVLADLFYDRVRTSLTTAR
jgi:lysophospholipase L1-like esterase